MHLSTFNMADLAKILGGNWTANGQVNARCPFKHLHSADSRRRKQFYATPEMNAYHCFSCKSKGRLTELLTTKYGVPLSDAVDMVIPSLTGVARKARVDSVEEVLSLTPPAFLLDRFKADTLKTFSVGREVSDKQEVATIPVYFGGNLKGVLRRKDVHGRKYIKSNVGFDRYSVLYNWDRCLYPETTLVEGFTDVWRLFECGVPDACASLGTSLSPEQIHLLSEKEVVYLAYDNDWPGTRECLKNGEKLSRYTEVRVLMHNLEDPGDANNSEEYWLSLYDEAPHFFEYKAWLLSTDYYQKHSA